MPHSYGWHACSGYHSWLSLYLEFARLHRSLDLFPISTAFVIYKIMGEVGTSRYAELSYPESLDRHGRQIENINRSSYLTFLPALYGSRFTRCAPLSCWRTTWRARHPVQVLLLHAKQVLIL